MRGTISLAIAAAVAFIVPSLAAPTPKHRGIVVHPGDAGDLIITADNTLNGTAPSDRQISTNSILTSNGGTQQLEFAFVNNLPSSNVNAYVTGIDPNNVVVMLAKDGSWFYPDAGGSAEPVPVTGDVAIPLGPQGSTTNIKLPDYISSARIWFADGTLSFFVLAQGSNQALVQPSAANSADPSAATNWGFVELTNTAEGGIYANISYVDFVGLILGMTLTGSAGDQSALGLSADATKSICADLITQAGIDGMPWDKLCLTDSAGNPLRVLAPSDYISSNPDAFSDYWTKYIDDVYKKYSNETLTVDTQSGPGKVACTVSGDSMTCEGDEIPYGKPTPADIFGCSSGAFANTGSPTHLAVLPRLCAAFNRGTLLLDGGNVQPALGSDMYYTTSPNNHFSRIVHKYEIDGKGYAFSYDDVNPSGENESGTVVDPTPTLLTVIIGGPGAGNGSTPTNSSAIVTKMAKRTIRRSNNLF
jgi:hypothetical protein